MSRRILPLALVALLLGAVPSRARADIQVTATDVTVTGNGTGIMDFTISSSTGDSLSAFGLTLQITPVNPAAGGGDLYFSDAISQPNAWDAQPDPSNPSLTGSSYVFYNVSAIQASGGAYWGDPTTTSYLSDTITSAADAYNPPTPNPSGADSVLLSRAYYLGSVQFQVSLAGGTYFSGSGASDLNFSLSSGGLVTIDPYTGPMTSAVPEPISTITGLTGAFFFTAYGWLRLRRSSR